MTPWRILSRKNVPAVIVGSIVAFVVGERLVEAIRPALLLDPDPGWLAARLLLWLGLLAATSAAGALAAALFLLWARSRFAPSDPEPLPFRAITLTLIGLGVFAGGVLLRFAWLDRLLVPLWIDDLSLIGPTLALDGTWHDFANSIRPAPYGAAQPYGSVGVLYLEFYRLCLKVAGTTVLGVRLPSALAGVASVGTAMFLGRALLPRGGGALAGLALAGMRWHLILSRWGWVAIALAPVFDVATLLLVVSRRRRNIALAAAAGLTAGLATHIYLSAWVGAAALLLLGAWPLPPEGRDPRWILREVAFMIALAVAAAPLFLLKEGRTSPYLARASDHNLALEIRREKSIRPFFGVAADAFVAPWFLADPTQRHDLPGRSRLGWIVGALVFVGLAAAILQPCRDISAYLLANAAAAFAATVVGGRATVPNGFRFGYLSDVAAVAGSGGALVVLGMFLRQRRRVAAISLTGLLAIASLVGARDALEWTEARSTFDGFWGQDTLIARAAARWDMYGSVDLDSRLGKQPLAIRAARAYGLDPDRKSEIGNRNSGSRAFRIVGPDSAPEAGERLVERVNDTWGREWARVYGRRGRRALGGVIVSDIPTRAGG